MRQTNFAVSNILLCGALMSLSQGLHAEIVTGANPPDVYNSANQPSTIAALNKAFANKTISYQDYEAGLMRLEKSVTTDTPASSLQGSSAATALNAPLVAGPTYIGSTSFTINWLANGNPSGTFYQIQISTDPTFTSSATINAETASLSASFTGLNPNTQYYVRVRAIDDNLNTTAFTELAPVTTLPAYSSGPTFISTNDRGVYGGNHYWEIYFALPAGDTCISASTLVSHGPNNIAVYLAPGSSVSESYAGPSGFSNNVCQVNVYAPAGTSTASMQFDYNTYVDTHIEGTGTPVGSLSLSF